MGLLLDIVDKVVPRVQERVSKGEGLKKVLYEELEKEKSSIPATTQGKELDTKTTTDIIPLGTDLDNGEIYDIETGQTTREL